MNAQTIESAFSGAAARFARAKRHRFPTACFDAEIQTDKGLVKVLKYKGKPCEVRAAVSVLCPSGEGVVIAHRTTGRTVQGEYVSSAEGEPWFSRTFRTIGEAKAFLLSVFP